MHPTNLNQTFMPKPVLTVKQFIEEFERWIRFGARKKRILKYTYEEEGGYLKETELNPRGSAKHLFLIFRNELKRDSQNIDKLENLEEEFGATYPDGRQVTVAIPAKRIKRGEKPVKILDLLKRDFERLGLVKIWNPERESALEEEKEPITKDEFYRAILKFYCFELARQKIIKKSQREELLEAVMCYPNKSGP